MKPNPVDEKPNYPIHISVIDAILVDFADKHNKGFYGNGTPKDAARIKVESKAALLAEMLKVLKDREHLPECDDFNCYCGAIPINSYNRKLRKAYTELFGGEV